MMVSGTVALAYGVIADVIRPADRGQTTGLLNAWYVCLKVYSF